MLTLRGNHATGAKILEIVLFHGRTLTKPAIKRAHPRGYARIMASKYNGDHGGLALINALANPDPWPTSNIELRMEQGCTTLINRRHIAELRAAMLATRFVGTLYLHSLPSPFEQNVHRGQFQVAPGKDIEIGAHNLEITLLKFNLLVRFVSVPEPHDPLRNMS